MKVIMRLYRQYDLDLIYLFKMKGFSLPDAIKKSVVAYITNEKYRIPCDFSCDADGEVVLPKVVQFHVFLDDVEDADIINWLSHIRRGYRNSVLKNLIRNYFDFPVLFPYFDGVTVRFTQHTPTLPDITPLVEEKDKNKTDNYKKEMTKENVVYKNLLDEVLHSPDKSENEPSKIEKFKKIL